MKYSTIKKRRIQMIAKKFTQEQVDNRISDRICWECGRQFLMEEQKGRHVGMAPGKCGLCRKKKFVSHMRDWNYLKLPEVRPKFTKTEDLIYEIFRLCDRIVWEEDFPRFQKAFEIILKAKGYNLWKIYFNVSSEKEWRIKCRKSWEKYKKAEKRRKKHDNDPKNYYIKDKAFKIDSK